jgi:hypothetical protein
MFVFFNWRIVGGEDGEIRNRKGKREREANGSIEC